MKKSILILLLLVSALCEAQTIKHHSYIVYFNPKIHAPDSVSWNLSPSNICKLVPRKNKFAKDPLNPNSPKPSDFIQLPGEKTNKTLELAQGHLYSYESAMCNPIDNTECFYVDQMYSQYQAMNAGDWKTIEVYERQLASKGTIHVIAGYINTTTVLNGRTIPPIAQTLSTGLPIVSYMYKAIYDGSAWHCWIMPNLPTTKGHSYAFWIVSTQTLDQKTGLRL